MEWRRLLSQDRLPCAQGVSRKNFVAPISQYTGEWILVTMGPKQDSKSFRGELWFRGKYRKNFCLSYACHISETNTFTWEGTGISSKNPTSVVSGISSTSVTIFSFAAYRRQKRQWEGQIIGTSHLSICFLQIQHWALSVGRMVLGVEQLIKKSCEFFIKPVSLPACRQVAKMIASTKMITLANRNFEVNQSILVYDPTMGFKSMQKS